MRTTNMQSTDFAREDKEDIEEDSELESPVPDNVQEFWLKDFTNLHKNLVWHLSACLEGKNQGG